jgi:thiosulfate reductase cytochrome b subunit
MTYSIDTRQAFAGDKRPPIQSLNEIKAVEISFEEHEIYAGERAIARIIYNDEDFITQPWMVIINGLEVHRANTWAICYNYITWHFKQGTLPHQKEAIGAVNSDTSVPRRCSQRVRSGYHHRIALPVFVSKQSRKLRQVAFSANFILRIYFKYLEALKKALNYLILLFKRQAQSSKAKYYKT